MPRGNPIVEPLAGDITSRLDDQSRAEYFEAVRRAADGDRQAFHTALTLWGDAAKDVQAVNDLRRMLAEQFHLGHPGQRTIFNVRRGGSVAAREVLKDELQQAEREQRKQAKKGAK